MTTVGTRGVGWQRMQVRVLGPLDVVRGSTSVELAGAQQRRLLTALVLAAGQVVAADRLIAALWDDEPPASAVKSLRAHVSRLRTALGRDRDRITTHDGGYALRLAAEDVDAGRFEELVDRARAVRPSDPPTALSLLQEALALWRGPAHADFAAEAFVRADAVRLEELRLAAHEERFDLLLVEGRSGQAIGEITAFARRHPLRERPHAQLMLALYRDGRQAHALDEFQRLRTALAEELGLEPSAALAALERDILRRDPRLDGHDPGHVRPHGVAGRSVDRRTTDRSDSPPPLLERDDHLRTLDGLLAAVVGRRQGRVAVVRGEAGVGKSALVAAFCARREPSVRVLRGACDALFTPRPLGPIRDIANVVGGQLQVAVRDGAEPYDVAADLSDDLRATAPSVLVFEDLHWADEATLDIVRLLGRRVASLPVLIVLTYRDDEIAHTHPLRRVLGELAPDAAVSELRVMPLSPSAVSELAAPSDRDGTHVHAVTGGNPLFVAEMLASATDEVPVSVRHVVLGRASALDPPARKMLEAIAAMPSRAEIDVVDGIADVDAAHLDACIASGLVVASGSDVAFRHELARRAVADATPAHRRRTLHRRALDVLMQAPPDRRDLAQLAHHAEVAGDVDAVVEFADLAGREAASVGAHREAAAHYARVLRYADGLEPATRADLLERRARSCYLTDQNADAIEAMEAAVRLRERLGDTLGQGDALRQLAQYLWCPGRTRDAMDRARQAVDLLERRAVDSQLGMAYSTVAQLAMNAEDIQGTRTWGRRAIDVAEAIGDVGLAIHARTNIATVAALSGESSARAGFDACVAAADAAGLAEHMTRALLNRAVAAVRRHDYGDAQRCLDRAEAICGELGHELMLFYVRAYQAVVALDTGHWQPASDLAGLVLRYPRTSTVPRILALSVTALVAARTHTGDPRPALDLADDLAASTDELERMVPPTLARAEVAWLEQRSDDIPRITATCWELSMARGATWMAGPLAAWRLRAGLGDELPAGVAEPYALQAAGRDREAARWWEAVGCRYAAALSLVDAGDAASARRASDIADELGARGVAGRRPASGVQAR